MLDLLSGNCKCAIGVPARGDSRIVWKLDRLGRDLRHLINAVHDLTRSIGLKVLTGHGASIDATTLAGKLVFGSVRIIAPESEPFRWSESTEVVIRGDEKAR